MPNAATPLLPSRLSSLLLSVSFVAASCPVLLAQQDLARVETPGALPDAPSPNPPMSSSSDPIQTEAQAGVAKTAPTSHPAPPPLPPVAGRYSVVVAPGQVGGPQSPSDKLVGSLRNSIAPFSLTGELIAAGYSHLTNGSPNFGTDSGAFASRFGAAVARGTSQKIFADGVLAAALREDPRYYQLGSKTPFVHRVLYAVTRPLITRTDAGHTTPNVATLGGYLGAAYLTRTYNPVLNQSNTEVLKIYGSSLGGAALGDAVTEFLPDALAFVHLDHVRFLRR